LLGWFCMGFSCCRAQVCCFFFSPSLGSNLPSSHRHRQPPFPHHSLATNSSIILHPFHHLLFPCPTISLANPNIKLLYSLPFFPVPELLYSKCVKLYLSSCLIP